MLLDAIYEGCNEIQERLDDQGNKVTALGNMVWSETRTAVLENITLAALDRYFEMHEKESETVSQVNASSLV
jgi:ATP-dependent DNA ligase